MKIRRTALDRLFSQLVRTRAGYQCEACHTTGGTMDCAHVLSRRHVLTRWDTLNAVCLCRGCHMWFTDRPFDWVDWCQSNLGADTVRALRERANANEKLSDDDRRAIGEDLVRAIEELGEKPVCGLGRRLTRKKKPKAKSRLTNTKLKRKVSGEVVAR